MLQTVKQSFETYDTALGALSALRPAIDQVVRGDRNLADQMRRAATSVIFNLAESSGSVAGNRKLRFSTALGSQREVVAALDAAFALGYTSKMQHVELVADYDRVGALLYRLVHTKR